MIGWFGPRGIASVLYLLLVVNELGLSCHERILSVIVLTVLLSVFLHGLSAVPMSHLYARHAQKEAIEMDEFKLQTSASLGGRFALKRDPGCAPLEDQKFSNVERVYRRLT
jgi:NhaP-type Na+/H+ or K+/H+ antiporter